VELWIVVALVAGLIAVRHVAIRRIERGQGIYVWIYFAPTALAMAYVIWVAAQLWDADPIPALLLLLVAVPSLLLFARMMRRMAADAGSESTGELSSPAFDYVIWMAIGMPTVFIICLILVLVTGKLGE
jgi:hypothetical protein